MARCNCSDAKCTCVIKAGAGVTVTGNGRSDNPYVVEAEAGGGGSSGFQPGDLKWTARPTAPAGWLVANGTPVSRTTYSALFAAIGTAFGAGDGSTTFTLPDYTGRFMFGLDATHPRATVGGSLNVTLAAANLPAHTHTINHDHAAATTSSDGQHDHQLRFANNTGTAMTTLPKGQGPENESNDSPSAAAMLGDGAHTHTLNLPAFTGTSGSTGSGTPVPIMPPYATALPLIKT